MTTTHYLGSAGRTYFEATRQSRLPTVQARKAARIAPYVNVSGPVVDFRCGDGALLANLSTAAKIGVEINPPSISEAVAKGLTVYPSTKEITDGTAATVIANHSLEHVLEPRGVLQEFYRILVPSGKAIIVLPAEHPGLRKFQWREDDHNQHLYSWVPLSIGNLLTRCGFRVERCFCVPVGESRYVNWLPEPLARVARRILALVLRRRIDIICVAVKG